MLLTMKRGKSNKTLCYNLVKEMQEMLKLLQ